MSGTNISNVILQNATENSQRCIRFVVLVNIHNIIRNMRTLPLREYDQEHNNSSPGPRQMARNNNKATLNVI